MADNLLKTRRFWPLLATQFLGALNDNMFKNALLTMVTLQMADKSDVLANVIAGLFILPFFLFSATAGQIADKHPRDAIARWLKLAEVVLMLGVLAAYLSQSLVFLIVLLALMGAQSAFFGPVKYSLLPQHLAPDELIAGNAYIEATTYAAILLGLILGTLLSAPVVIGLLIALAVVGYFTAVQIPSSPAPRPEARIGRNPLRALRVNYRFIRRYKQIFSAILGATWFWAVGAFVAVQVYPLAGKVINASEGVITWFLILFSLGVAVGAWTCNRMFRGVISANYAPVSALGMGLCLYAVYALAEGYPTAPAPVGFIEFWTMPRAAGLSAALFALALCGGIYVVPLNAFMQARAPKKYVATVIASNNIFNALGMVLSAVFAVALLALGLDIAQLFLAMAIVSLFVTVYICKLLPDALTRSLVQALLRVLFKSRVKGLENFQAAGRRVLLVCNHVSLLDGVLLAAMLPERITFAINTAWTRRFSFIINILADFYPIDPTNPLSLRALIEEIKKGRKVMMFPEGRVSTTGSMMKVYDGAAIVAAKAGAKVVPMAITGAKYSKFAYLSGKFRTRWFPKVDLAIFPPREFVLGKDRAAAGRELYGLMGAAQLAATASDFDMDLFSHLEQAADLAGRESPAVEDERRRVWSYKDLIRRSRGLGEAFARAFAGQQRVRIGLPLGVDFAVAFFALQYAGKVAVFGEGDEIGELHRYKIGRCWRRRGPVDSNAAAAVFGEVELTHGDILQRCGQFGLVFPFTKNDVAFNPLASGFGVIYGFLAPLFSGSKVFLFGLGDNAKAATELCYDAEATVVFGDDQRLAAWGQVAHSYDFFAAKYAVCAEGDLAAATFDLWVRKFGVRILAGEYSTKEARLVRANTPVYNEYGTKGGALPGE